MDSNEISRIYQYFEKNKAALDWFEQVKKRQSLTSLRLIEYTLTNYVLIHPIEYFVICYVDETKLSTYLAYDDPQFTEKWEKIKAAESEVLQAKKFNVRDEYELMFRKYHKRFFDPCCRSKNTMKIRIGEVETVFKQIHFFYWAFDHALIYWIQDHKKSIKVEMSLDEEKKKKAKEKAASKQEYKPRLSTLQRKRERIVNEKEEMPVFKMPFTHIIETHHTGDVFEK